MSSLMEPSSMSKQNESAEAWPQDGAPESWVNALFAKMARMWGNSFLDKWPADDLRGVKIEWAKGLRKLSTAELKSGVDSLLTLKYAPSLPDFFGLCKQMRLHEMPAPTALTDQTRASPEVVAEAKAHMQGFVRRFMEREPSAEWAYQMLIRGQSKYLGRALTYETVRCASDAITSGAGRKVIEDCTDPQMREEYRTIRDSIIEGRRSVGEKLWETA